jgi:hypothetical protein
VQGKLTKEKLTGLPSSLRAATPVVAQPRLPLWLIAALLVLVTMAVYWPAMSHDFVNYDDDIYVTDNPNP